MNQEHRRSDEEERSRAPLGGARVEWWRWIELCMLDGCRAGGGGLGREAKRQLTNLNENARKIIAILGGSCEKHYA